MPLTLRVIPGYQFFEGERLDTNKLNQLGRPTIELLGSISSAIIAPGSITADKLSPGLISQLPHETDPEGRDLLMIEDVSTVSLKNITISQVLTMGIRDLPTVTDVKFGDFALVIQGGINKQATIGNVLRESISGQTELTGAGAIDSVNDMVMLWDANAADNTNKNRKTRIGYFVASFTNTLIEQSNPFSGVLDPGSEVLLRDTKLTKPNQQVRFKLSDLATLTGGTKAWANIKASEVIEEIGILTWNDADDVIIIASPQGLSTGDWIWFRSSDSGSGVLPWIAYYIRLLDGQTTQFRLFNTKAGALANDTAQLVHLDPGTAGRIFLHWDSNPIRAGANIASIITTTRPDSQQGYFRILFENPLPTANYSVQVTGSRYKDEGSGTSAEICAINVAGPEANPTNTENPTVDHFDVVCRNNSNDESVPDYLMIAVFA